jgi:UDP-N-acetylglucosamine--N-acetylmuramyl-(pentapeptide) pyrophosphoryl-undecaprenol N-acetylglucosamine transferase
VLFESNALPGKVNRLFSQGAKFTAVYFPGAAQYLRGEVVEVDLPVCRPRSLLSAQEARRYFGLKEDLFTVVVFGGSQGSAKLNEIFTQTALELFQSGAQFQVIHLAGNSQAADQVRELYQKGGMTACVKDFEAQMEFSYTAASLVVSRAGAATVAELIAYAQPSILVPYPYASENHQQKNAEFLSHELKAAIQIQESELSSDRLSALLTGFLDPNQTRYAEMKHALEHTQSHQFKAALCPLICHFLSLQ